MAERINPGPDVAAIEVTNLTFGFPAPSSPVVTTVLHDVSLQLPQGARCVLVGSNGAGKSTLLQILAGKRMVRGACKVLDQPVFFSTPPGVTYLGTEWAANPVVRSDVEVSTFLNSIGGYRHKERRDKLLDLLDVDLSWHMHAVSDGERRRVQIVSGLMAPFRVLLLDEVTVDLDVLVRSRLLNFLREESEGPNRATVLYATHIFDGLDHFPTHVSHLRLGRTVPALPVPWPVTEASALPAGVIEKMNDPKRVGSRLLELALAWLEEDWTERLAEEKKTGKKSRGREEEGVVTDSEAFYRKYDYSH